MTTNSNPAGRSANRVIAFPVGGRVTGRHRQPVVAQVEADRQLRDVLGEVLREERHRQDRTLTDVATEAAVSVPYLSEVERGRKEVSSEVLKAIHEALGLELQEVLERSAQRLAPEARAYARATLLAA